jgi:DNA-directed RNA polymerase I, II, and III subunit RPABC2
VEIGNLKDPIDIANKELREGKMPLSVRRRLPNGYTEIWKVTELQDMFRPLQ